jgi:hypothetical protein
MGVHFSCVCVVLYDTQLMASQLTDLDLLALVSILNLVRQRRHSDTVRRRQHRNALTIENYMNIFMFN